MLREYGEAAWLACGFFIAGTVSILISRFGDGIAGVWFANVLGFAVLTRRRRPVGLVDYGALSAASLALNTIFGSAPVMAVLLSAANLGLIALSIALVRRFVGGQPLRIAGARDFVLTLALAGGVAIVTVATVFGLAAALLGGRPPLWAGWTLLSANALGTAILLPLLLFVSRAELRRLCGLGTSLRLVATCLFCAGVGLLSLAWGQFPFVLAMLPLIVAALHVGVFELAIACAFTGATLIMGAMIGIVPSLGHGIGAFRGDFQLAVAITVATPFMVGLFVRQIVEDRRRFADAETRWNFALASAGQGMWDFDMRKGGTTYSAAWTKMLGYEQHELDGDPGRWLTMIHPEDRDTVEAADRAHLEGRSPYFEAEFRMQRKDGQWLWIMDRGKIIERDQNGGLVRAIGSLTDITARKEAEQRLRVSAAHLAAEKERLRVTLQSIGDAVICTDASDRVTFMNPVAEKLAGVVASEVLGGPLDAVYRPVDEETGQRLGATEPTADGRRRSSLSNRAVLVRRDGTRCNIRQVVSPIVNEQNVFDGSVIVFQDFTDARTLQRQLAHAAAHDALTGLANRSSFIRTMEAMVAKAKAGGPERQFMFIDLDHFKLVNDTGGHAAGDALLKRVAGEIKGALGSANVVARIGGDEFAAVLQSGSAADALAAAEAVIGALRGLDFSWNGRAHAIGASIGLASIHAACGEVDEIIARADAACYAAKAAGRGCALAAEPDTAGEPSAARASAAGF